MLSATIGRISGRTINYTAYGTPLQEDVNTRKDIAQNRLGIAKGLLLDVSGGVLDGCASIEEAGLWDDDFLTFQVNRVEISCGSRYSEHFAFAVVLGDGSVAMRGDRQYGAESTAVQ